ncbi:MAG: 16S rRNA (cytosine(1402)-N(4))-methyltransferase RsmH [bacterium]
MKHIPVLLSEVLKILDPKPGQFVVDGTIGSGGHSQALLQIISKKGRLLGIDRDPETIIRLKDTLSAYSGQVTLVADCYQNLPAVLHHYNLPSPNIILLDLGLSSIQLDDKERGFSFQQEGPLDMRFDRSTGLTAQQLLDHSSAETLRKIFKEYGQEPLAGQIARAVKENRPQGSLALAKIAEQIYAKRYHRPSTTHPATRIFQALRIAVNDELVEVAEGIKECFKVLAPKGRMAVITFHSLEDRIVKQFFRSVVQGIADPLTGQRTPFARNLTTRAIMPSEQEKEANSRSRSAKIRAIEKLIS